METVFILFVIDSIETSSLSCWCEWSMFVVLTLQLETSFYATPPAYSREEFLRREEDRLLNVPEYVTHIVDYIKGLEVNYTASSSVQKWQNILHFLTVFCGFLLDAIPSEQPLHGPSGGHNTSHEVDSRRLAGRSGWWISREPGVSLHGRWIHW